MAREVIIRIRDDLDPESLADKTVQFAYNGTEYEIDLNAEHCDEFDAVLQRFVQAARVVVPEPKPRSKHKHKTSSGGHHTPETLPIFEQRTRIREWARGTGFHVAESGLLARRIIEAYRDTHPQDPILPGTWCKTPKPKKRNNNRAPNSVVAQDGSEQSAMDLLGAMQSSGGAKTYTLTGRNGKEYVQVRDQAADRAGKPLRDKMRAWANANGIPVAVKSRVPEKAVQAYMEAHPEEFNERGLPVERVSADG